MARGDAGRAGLSRDPVRIVSRPCAHLGSTLSGLWRESVRTQARNGADIGSIQGDYWGLSSGFTASAPVRTLLHSFSQIMGNLKKKRRLKMSKHKRRKRLKSNRHKKRTWQK